MSKLLKELDALGVIIRDLREAADAAQAEANTAYFEANKAYVTLGEIEDEMADAYYTENKLSEEVVNDLIELIRQRKGFTYHANLKAWVKPNTRAGMRLAVAQSEHTVRLGEAYIKDAEALAAILQAVAKSEQAYIGGWYDRENGGYLIEGVKIHNDAAEAYENMISGGQVSLYDFSIDDEVTLTTLHTLDQLSGGDRDAFKALYDEFTDAIINKRIDNNRGAE